MKGFAITVGKMVLSIVVFLVVAGAITITLLDWGMNQMAAIW